MNFNTKNLTGDRYLNIFLSGLVEIPALIFVVLVHNRLGRRLTVSLLMCISGFFSFAILVLHLVGKFDGVATVCECKRVVTASIFNCTYNSLAFAF